MADFPYLDKEEKKRRSQSLARNTADSTVANALRRAQNPVYGATELARRGLGGLATDVGALAAYDFGNVADSAGAIGSAIISGTDGAAHREAAIQRGALPPNFSNVTGSNATSEYTPENYARGDGRGNLDLKDVRANSGAYGLTRVVKTVDAHGNSIYSNVAGGSGGETRYYNQYGNREGQLNPNDPTSGYRTDFDTNPEALANAVDGGQKSLGYVARSNRTIADNAAAAELAALDPASRASLMRTQMTEQGANQRAAGTLQRQDDRLKFDQGKLAFDQQGTAIKADQILQDREKNDPAGAINNMLDSFGNMPKDQILKLITDPSSAQGARMQALMQRAIGTQIGDENVDLKTLTRTGKFRQAIGGDGVAIGSDSIWKTGASVKGVTDNNNMLLADAMRIIAAQNEQNR